MRENLKVLDTKFDKVIYQMALVKNQRYSKNFKNIEMIRRFNILIKGINPQRLRYYRLT